ncbi:MAG: ribosome biogenesis GTP-binding protein YihA/YsxC [Bacteroidales bacterium]|nr:ribosome biogenesis GTP-binding protein YihA/YsxC [Bacteroidales bacterium]
MQIRSSRFLMSNQNVSQCPNTSIPEYAFIGRSNVGKSSLINMLCQHNVAKVSGTPGKTQLINHFLINDEWHLVDLPGYGYAKVSKSVKEKFQSIITDYVLGREQLTSMFVLVDCRHEPQKIDMEFMSFLGENEIPFSIIFTKADKLRPSELEHNIEVYKNKMLEEWEEMPNYFVTSSDKGIGKNDVLDYIEQINNELAK